VPPDQRHNRVSIWISVTWVATSSTKRMLSLQLVYESPKQVKRPSYGRFIAERRPAHIKTTYKFRILAMPWISTRAFLWLECRLNSREPVRYCTVPFLMFEFWYRDIDSLSCNRVTLPLTKADAAGQRLWGFHPWMLSVKGRSPYVGKGGGCCWRVIAPGAYSTQRRT
jgi:hypothetical protein